jgi:hypothetical protein
MKGKMKMATCLYFVIHRQPQPLCLFFDITEDAVEALQEFARRIESAQGDTVILINCINEDHVRCLGFLKRDFISVELSFFADEDNGDDNDDDDQDGDDDDDGGDDTGQPGPWDAIESDGLQSSSSDRAVEAATMLLMAAAREHRCQCESLGPRSRGGCGKPETCHGVAWRSRDFVEERNA